MRQPIPFGKYYLLERVNVGGMAEVFKAKATGVEGFERLVAVKRILPSIAEDEEFITMFIDEAKIAVQLTHANIAQIFDLGKVDDSYFIALEYVHGKDLRAIFNRARARGEQLPVPLACYVIMKLCEGLDYAHNKRDAGGQFLNLVHRDVSPQNILVSYEGEVKIIDFGIAKAAGKAGRTQAGILKGKFGYMSPEQVQGMEIDRRSDVFGVGICLYELLTGERLFVGESDFATLEKVRNVDIMPPSTYNRRVPEELEQIVLKALARDRNARHQTAMQLHDELQGFMYGSGNFFGRRDLSMYMHRAFAEEIERETARDQEYVALGVGDTHDEITGLNAFEEIDPVSSVSALNRDPNTPVSNPQAMYAQPASGPDLSGRPHKATLLGVPSAVSPRTLPPPGPFRPPSAPPRVPSVPPLVPRPQSIPPSAPAAPPRLDMDWDDEEMSTQIYDRPEDRTPAPMMQAPQGPISGSYPPVLAPTPQVGSMPLGYAPTPAVAQPAAGGYRPHPQHQGGYAQPGAPSPFMLEAEVARERRASTSEVEWPPRSAAPQKRSMLFAVLAVVLILGVIVGALALFRKPAPGTVHLATVPPDVSVALDGHPITGSSPFIIEEVSPDVPHEIVVSKNGFRPWTSKFELQADQTMQLPPVALEADESGFSLDSVPSGAHVFVDGKEIERVTPVRVTDLQPGDHQIRLEADGFARWESSLHVTPGSVLELPTAQLIARAAEGAAAVAAAVAAPAVRTPSAAPAPSRAPSVPAAAARPKPVRPPKPTVVASAEPEPEAKPEPEPEAKPSKPEPEAEPEPSAPEPSAAATGGGSTGTLRVQTRPWSKVFVDGKFVGNTPLMGVEVPAGRRTLTFVNDEFGIRKVVKLQVSPGQVTTQVLTLTD